MTLHAGSETCATQTTVPDALEYGDRVLERALCLRLLRDPTDHIQLEPRSEARFLLGTAHF